MKTHVCSSRSWYLVLALLAAPAMRPAIAQDAFPTVIVSATDSHASEAGPDTGTFTVIRHVANDTPPPNSSLVVFYQVRGTASNGVDYQTLSGSVTIPPLALGATVTVTPIDDDAVEGEERVVLQLTSSPLACATCGYNIGVPSNAVVVIADNDGPPPTNHPPFVQLNAPQNGVFIAPTTIALRAYAKDAEDGFDPFASEGTNFWRRYTDANTWITDTWSLWHVNVGGTNTATFVVRRHGPTNDDLTVKYQVGGTASNGVDYLALSGAATIPAGKRTARIVVVPMDGALSEGIETVGLKLPPSPDYAVGFPSQAAAIIIDNDRPRPPCVLLPDHQFHLCQPATNGFCFRVEASTDLQNWIPICTNVVTDGALHFVDPDAPLSNVRFYRVEPETALPPDD